MTTTSGSPTGCLHGYSATGRDRLQRQARFLEPLVHDRLPFRPRRKVLEVGDNREVERAETLADWSDLLLSGAPAPLDAGKVTSEVAEGMRKELARAARDPNCVFFYAFIQAGARAW